MAAKKEDEAPVEEYEQPEWSITVTEVVGTERVEIKPFGWVGAPAIVTSVEKAHNLGKLLADVKHLTELQCEILVIK